MKKTVMVGLGAFGVLLLCVIAWEVLQFQMPTSVSPRYSSAVARSVRQPAAPRLSDGDVQLASILARPLFSPSRTAPAEAPGTLSDHVPRLTGIVITPAGKWALFAPADGRSLLISEGQTVGPYVVRMINADNVTVSGPAGYRVLHLVFSSDTGPSNPTTETAASPTSPFSQLSALPNLPSWLKPATPDDLPSASNWGGPSALSRLPVTSAHPASVPLLQPAPDTALRP
jgi:hypothetical protein